MDKKTQEDVEAVREMCATKGWNVLIEAMTALKDSYLSQLRYQKDLGDIRYLQGRIDQLEGLEFFHQNTEAAYEAAKEDDAQENDPDAV